MTGHFALEGVELPGKLNVRPHHVAETHERTDHEDAHLDCPRAVEH